MYNNKIIAFSDVHYSDKNLSLISTAMDRFKLDCSIENPKIIVFCGDLFHTRVSSDDICYRTAISDIIQLSSFCEHLFIVKGTYSHDYDSLKIFEILNSIKPNITYVPTATSIIHNEQKLLFLPEEYPSDPTSFYSKFVSETYDYVFGHGDIQGAMLHSGIHNSLLKGFKWKPSLLSQMAKFSVFGHIHKHQFLTNNVLYCGSFCRTGFGEEEDKGYIKIDIDSDTCEFISLPSQDFLTVKIDTEEDFLSISEQELLHPNIKFKLPKELGHLRQELKQMFSSTNINFEATKDNNEENVLLYENISQLSISDQFLLVLESDILNKKITLKEQKYFNSSSVEKIISEIIEEIATSN